MSEKQTPPVQVEVTPVISGALESLSKAEEDLLQTKQLTGEDSNIFDSITTVDGRGADVIHPRYNPIFLQFIAMENNSLLQCVEAMEINIDGTGYSVERKDGQPLTEEDDEPVASIKDFFDYISPEGSFTTVRRQVRRDLEQTGNGYIEVLRDVSGEIVYMNHLEAGITRITKRDPPIVVTEMIKRRGKERRVQRRAVERRYAQVVGTKLVYFKQFGSNRRLHSAQGLWEGDEKLKTDLNPDGLVDDANNASEIIHLTLHKDPILPYGNPRWIAQTPSIMGSRAAEEYNFTFFKHGGLPPALIFIQGGAMSAPNRKALTDYLGARAKDKQRGAVIELFSTSGEIGGSGGSNVKVSVERFGAERQQDGMFLMYDKRCRENVRSSFRLPALFLGELSEVTFSSAYISSVITEAQVFLPERQEFDEFVNQNIMPEVHEDYLVRSNPTGLSDLQQQLIAISQGSELADPASLLDNLNQAANLNLKLRDGVDEEMMLQEVQRQIEEAASAQRTQDGQAPNIQKISIGDDGLVAKLDDEFLQDLAKDWSAHLTGTRDYSEDALASMKQIINMLDPMVKSQFDVAVGEKVAQIPDIDSAKTVYELIGLCSSMQKTGGEEMTKGKKRVRRISEARKPKAKRGTTSGRRSAALKDHRK